MLDRRIIREEPDLLRQAIRNRGAEVDVEELIRLDERRRELLAEVEQLKAERNRLSKEVGEAMRRGEEETAAALRARVSELKEQISAQEGELEATESLFEQRMLEVPNIPRPEVPLGAGPEDNVVIHERGQKPQFAFEPQPHWEIGERLGILDFAAGAKLAGARFVCDFGAAAQMERALINFMLDVHTRQHGYKEVLPPFMANARCLVGTGSLPKFEGDLFKTTEGFYLVPTAEVPLTNLHQDEILDASELPKYYTAYTPCFRSEAGAAGRESRGLIRLHQFNKVELMKFTTPETSAEELEKLTQNAEAILELLGLAYRRVILCTGDLGFGACRTYDLEVWMPGMGRWVEISSCSEYGDFQARRCNTRYRPEPDAKPIFVHTMNGSGLAVGRTLAAILENYQQENGSVVIPEVLRPYMGGRSEILPPLP